MIQFRIAAVRNTTQAKYRTHSFPENMVLCHSDEPEINAFINSDNCKEDTIAYLLKNPIQTAQDKLHTNQEGADILMVHSNKIPGAKPRVFALLGENASQDIQLEEIHSETQCSPTRRRRSTLTANQEQEPAGDGEISKGGFVTINGEQFSVLRKSDLVAHRLAALRDSVRVFDSRDDAISFLIAKDFNRSYATFCKSSSRQNGLNIVFLKNPDPNGGSDTTVITVDHLLQGPIQGTCTGKNHTIDLENGWLHSANNAYVSKQLLRPLYTTPAHTNHYATPSSSAASGDAKQESVYSLLNQALQ